MIVDVTGVMADGSVPDAEIAPLAPYRQDLAIPRGEDCVVRMAVFTAKREAADLGTPQSLRLGLRQFSDDTDPIFAVDGESEDFESGIVTFTIPGASTLDLAELVRYVYDVQFVDEDGARWQLVPPSKWLAGAIVVRPGE